MVIRPDIFYALYKKVGSFKNLPQKVAINFGLKMTLKGPKNISNQKINTMGHSVRYSKIC